MSARHARPGSPGRPRGLSRASVVLAAGVTTGALVLASCSAGDDPPSGSGSATPAAPVQVTFAVYGRPSVTAAYAEIAADYTAKHPRTVVTVQPYADHDQALAAVESSRGSSGSTSSSATPSATTSTATPSRTASSSSASPSTAPDLFLMDRSDLGDLLRDKVTQPVDELLSDRDVDFGDGFQRDGLEAFSADSGLQCMPTAVSPLVVYYNTALIDLTQLNGLSGRPVRPGAGWTFGQFGRAVEQASVGEDSGVYVSPELEQVAPFIWSGGGKVVDDQTDPTRLTLSQGAGRRAMERLLELVRNPLFTLGRAQLSESTALARFRAGHLAMILGYRDLTPTLRATPGLSFDVMPMPRLSEPATVARMSGVCLSRTTEHDSAAADFLAYLVSDDAQETLAETGAVESSNLDVANSQSFLQSDQQPATANVFNASVRYSRLLPDVAVFPQVEDSAALALAQLFGDPAADPETRLRAIDEVSQLQLKTDGGSPSGSGSPSPSASSTD